MSYKNALARANKKRLHMDLKLSVPSAYFSAQIFDYFYLSIKWHVPFNCRHCLRQNFQFFLSSFNWLIFSYSIFANFFYLIQASVQCFALVMATTEVECAIVKKATKVPNAKSQQESVKCRVALDMDDALRASAIVNVVSKEMTAPNVSFSTSNSISNSSINTQSPSCAIQISIVIFCSRLYGSHMLFARYMHQWTMLL